MSLPPGFLDELRSRTSLTQVGNQSLRVAIGNGEVFDIHHRITKAGLHECIADVVHVGERMHMRQIVHATPGAAQLFEGIRPEGSKQKQSRMFQYPARFVEHQFGFCAARR